MPVLILPWTFTNGTVADANQVDDDFAAVAAIVNALDNSNVGAGGFYASQIIPTNLTQATFGGGVGYTFRPQVTSAVPLSVRGANGQTADVFDITDFTNTIQMFVDSSFNLHVINALYNSNLQMGANSQITFNPTPANATNLIEHSSGLFDIATGCHWDGTQYVADATSTFIMRFDGGTSSPLICYANSGLTVGLGFVPTISWSTSNIGNLQFGPNIQLRMNPNQVLMAIGQAVYLGTGLHWDPVLAQWIADQTTASLFAMTTAGVTQIFFNSGLTVGVAFTPAQVLAFTATSGILAITGALTANGIFAGSGGLNSPNSCGIWSGTGAPAAGLGTNGDYYFRKDSSLGAHIYTKAAGTWTALIGSNL